MTPYIDYLCPICDNRRGSESEALTCCIEVKVVFVCYECDKAYEKFEDAEACCHRDEDNSYGVEP